ncbi:MAG: ketoacyl-ACP synthase III [Candidatus Dormibacteraeota bacterium]|nr:ketoacyl-ACP synthase III [Candidatus Dormibacteraeota bacterium]MBV9526261.1 ketoacyl-ACP synthase III [Candidatus Dormibacteraeota bacterium]
MPPLSAPSRQATGTVDAAARQAGFLGTGSFVPEGRLTNADLEAMVDTSDAWILERTGIRERRKAGSGLTASMMGAEAGRRAMAAAGVSTVDAIIVATCTGDSRIPSTACLVQRSLGLDGVAAFDINAACSGFLYGLILSRSLIATGAAETVLLIGSEALTTYIDYTDRSTCVLFGDGAGAVVVGAVAAGGVRAVRWAASGANSDLIYYGPKDGEPDTMNAMRMAGKGTFRMAVERLTEVASDVCADAGWRAEDIDLVVPHQANLRIMEAVTKRLGVPMERVMVNIDRMGNTSAASIPVAMAEAADTSRVRNGDRVLLMAFGSGVTWGAVALEWTGQPA